MSLEHVGVKCATRPPVIFGFADADGRHRLEFSSLVLKASDSKQEGRAPGTLNSRRFATRASRSPVMGNAMERKNATPSTARHHVFHTGSAGKHIPNTGLGRFAPSINLVCIRAAAFCAARLCGSLFYGLASFFVRREHYYRPKTNSPLCHRIPNHTSCTSACPPQLATTTSFSGLTFLERYQAGETTHLCTAKRRTHHALIMYGLDELLL